MQTHLATIRGRYRALLRDNALRGKLSADARAHGCDSPADIKAYVDEVLVRLENATHPDTAPVDVTTHQDTFDRDHLRLTASQAAVLMRAPGTDTLMGLRDTAIITLMLCTGIREAELVALNVDDLRQTVDGVLCLRVRSGKGNKSRAIPYGELDGCLLHVDAWMKSASIIEGAVFRGLYQGGSSVRPSRLSTRGMNRIFETRYPIVVNGQLRHVQPHDLRRTYARRLWETGMDVLKIKDNLGHASLDTTLGYIGQTDVRDRQSIAAYDLPAFGRIP